MIIISLISYLTTVEPHIYKFTLINDKKTKQQKKKNDPNVIDSSFTMGKASCQRDKLTKNEIVYWSFDLSFFFSPKIREIANGNENIYKINKNFFFSGAAIGRVAVSHPVNHNQIFILYDRKLVSVLSVLSCVNWLIFPHEWIENEHCKKYYINFSTLSSFFCRSWFPVYP